MKFVLDAIDEKGAFRPLQTGPVAISESQQVQITVDDGHVTNQLQLAASVYEGLSEDEIGEIERIALDRKRFFASSTVKSGLRNECRG